MTTSSRAAPKKYIGIDFGESNVGIALGANGFVYPIKVISSKNLNYAAQQISKIAIQNKVDEFVLGLPVTHEGKETKEAREVRKFAKLLKVISKKPVNFEEEADSTKEALEEAIELDIPMKRRRVKDHLAAGIILKRFFSKQED